MPVVNAMVNDHAKAIKGMTNELDAEAGKLCVSDISMKRHLHISTKWLLELSELKEGAPRRWHPMTFILKKVEDRVSSPYNKESS